MTRQQSTQPGDNRDFCPPHAGWVRPVQALTILLWALIAALGLSL